MTPFQAKVWKWCKDTFDGIAAWQTTKQRSYRFLEEACELFQAVGMDRNDALKVVEYVYGRPDGEASQEVGGVMITLLALASQQNIDVGDSMKTEFDRIVQQETQEKIRAKQKVKNQAFL